MTSGLKSIKALSQARKYKQIEYSEKDEKDAHFISKKSMMSQEEGSLIFTPYSNSTSQNLRNRKFTDDSNAMYGEWRFKLRGAFTDTEQIHPSQF